MGWLSRVRLKHLFTDSDDPAAVRASMAAIADVIGASPAFASFSRGLLKKFRAIPDGDDVVPPIDYANRLLASMYDYCDEHRIWVE